MTIRRTESLYMCVFTNWRGMFYSILMACLLVDVYWVQHVQSSEDSCNSCATLYAQDLNISTFKRHVAPENVKQYYRYLMVDPDDGHLYVGAMNWIFRLDLRNISNQQAVVKQNINADEQIVLNCQVQGLNFKPDCQNHIRFIARNKSDSTGDTLYVCGTGAYNPTGYNLSSENLVQRGTTVGEAMCPYDPMDNSTAVFVDEGNPGGASTLYSGTVTDINKQDPTIYRPTLHRADGGVASEHMRSVKHESKWLNEPQFVGSFDVGDQVYFFFREVALEYTNCGKRIYSRVAKVCKNDKGGPSILKNEWTSYQKARLNCSIPGEYPYYFDEIQDVYTVDKKTFYGLFTTNINGLTASAICAFTMADIEKAFHGPFKHQEGPNQNWLPVDEANVPPTRPGNCSLEDSKSLPDDTLSFIRIRPLMDLAVANQYGRPIFYKGNCLMQKLAVASNMTGHGELVFYTATNNGEVYKILAREDKPNKMVSTISTKYLPFDDRQPIWTMKLWGTNLYLGTDTEVTQVSVITCSRYTKVDLCVYDAYCGWNKKRSVCVSLQDEEASRPHILTYKNVDWNSLQLYKPNDPVNISAGLPLTLRVEYLRCLQGRVKWKKGQSKARLQPVILDKNYMQAMDNSLIISKVTDSDSEIFSAVDESGNEVASYVVKVLPDNNAIEHTWKEKFYEWCEEFKQYKETKHQWDEQCNSVESNVPGQFPSG